MTLQDKIKTNAKQLIDSFSLLTQAQLHFKSTPTDWSILECVEHIYLVNASVSKILLSQVTGKAENNATELFGEEKLNHLLVNKRAEFKIPAPDFVLPTGQFQTVETAVQHLNVVMDTIIKQLDKTDITKETDTIKHFRLGEMTKTDWVHFMTAHTNRHLLQVNDMKARYTALH